MSHIHTKRMLKVAAFGIFMLLIPALGFGGTLEERRNEWAIDVTSLDEDDFGTFTVIEIEWSYIFLGGRFELGAQIQAFEDDPDFGPSFDASVLGPVFTWNWLPRSERVTGYASATVAGVGGDFEDFFDGYTSVAVGAKIFVGNSAAIRVFVTSDTFIGKDGFEDLEQTRAVISLALYSHGR